MAGALVDRTDMSQEFQTDYQSISDMDRAPGSRKKFFVVVKGRTDGAHQDIVSNLESRGQTQVSFHNQSDYFLVFCPIASRVGTDISEALEDIPGGKPIILVVMHHTFNRDQVVAPSRRQVENPNVCLTVDCLFYEGNFYQCDRNYIAWDEIQKSLGLPRSSIPAPMASYGIIDWFRNHLMWVLIFCFVVATILIVIILAIEAPRAKVDNLTVNEFVTKPKVN